MSSESELEKGLDTRHGSLAPPAGSSPRNALDREHKTELEVFQTLAGIHFLAYGGGPLNNRQKPPASVLQDIFMPSKAAASRFRNRGLYDRSLSQDMKNRVMYSLSHYIIISLYILQILVAATLTGLSAYQRKSTVALTTLGAINTVLAGVLAWLTGQGMPIRFRRARDQYREVVKAIEQAERMFAQIDYISWAPGERPHPVKELQRLERLYDDARLDQEANYPETHQSPLPNKVPARNQESNEPSTQ